MGGIDRLGRYQCPEVGEAASQVNDDKAEMAVEVNMKHGQIFENNLMDLHRLLIIEVKLCLDDMSGIKLYLTHSMILKSELESQWT